MSNFKPLDEERIAETVDVAKCAEERRQVLRKKPLPTPTPPASSELLAAVEHFLEGDIDGYCNGVPPTRLEDLYAAIEAEKAREPSGTMKSLDEMRELLCRANKERDDLRARLKKAEAELLGVMHSVDKWLDGDELDANPATRAAEARENALKAIEKAEASGDEKLKRLREWLGGRQKTLRNGLPSQEPAREAARYWLQLCTEGTVEEIDRLLSEPVEKAECECDRSVGENCPECYAPHFDKPTPPPTCIGAIVIEGHVSPYTIWSDGELRQYDL